MNRTGSLARKTGETDIFVSLDLDGEGVSQIDTGIGFFDHMLSAVAKHGLMDLTVRVQGDLAVDGHHTVEDTGIVLGAALAQALGDKKGIRRVGSCFLPMDESLASDTWREGPCVSCTLALDRGRRELLLLDGSGARISFDAAFPAEMCGGYASELTEEFFRAVSVSSGITLHLKAEGRNTHHMIEALYKAFARALRDAAALDPRVKGVPSTKGVL